MHPAVHLRPDRLRAHAAAAVELAGTLESARAARPPAAGERGTAELDTALLDNALRRATRELAELAAVLAEAAAIAESADRESALALNRAAPS